MTNAGALLEKGVLDAGLEDREAKEELAKLFDKNFMELAAEADGIRRSLHPNDIVTYIVDRNINYTNVCWVACSFCAFYRTKRQAPEGDGAGPPRAPPARQRHVHRVPEHQLYARVLGRLLFLRLLQDEAPGAERRRLRALHRAGSAEDTGDRRPRWYRHPHARRVASGHRDGVHDRPVSRHPQGVFRGTGPRALAGGDLASRRQEWAVPGRDPQGTQNGRADEHPGRRGGEPHGRDAWAHSPGQELYERVARGHGDLAQPRDEVHGDDDVRDRRVLRGACRAPASDPGAPDQDRRLHGVHRLDLPAGQHDVPEEAPELREGELARLLENHGGEPHRPRQRGEHSSVVGHAAY